MPFSDSSSTRSGRGSRIQVFAMRTEMSVMNSSAGSRKQLTLVEVSGSAVQV